MKIKENKVTLIVTLLSKIELFFCDNIVTETAVITLINSNMDVSTKNIQGVYNNSVSCQQTPGFVRSLFALCSLQQRRKSVYKASLE